MASDYDGAWKDVLHEHLRDALRCFFPDVESGIDWSRPPQFLEQELRALSIEGWNADNRIDLLVRTASLDGLERVIYLHLEVQSFREDDFSARLFRSYHGLRHACGSELATLAVLADLDPGWKPQSYSHAVFGCEVFFRFPCCKLIEILPSLEGDRSLPALAARAQIEALSTSRHPERRLAARWRLTRQLYECGYSRTEVRNAFALLARMMRLPPAQSLTFRDMLIAYERQTAMPYVTDIEEMAIERGLEQGRQEGWEQGREEGREISLRESVVEVLTARFGELPPELCSEILTLSGTPKLHEALRAAARCDNLNNFRIALQN